MRDRTDAVLCLLAGLVVFLAYVLAVGVGLAVVVFVAVTVLELLGVTVPVLGVVA
jgi:hypothetical protein